MGNFRLDRLLEMMTSYETFLAALWLGLIGLTIGLLLLMRTRWGQYRPLRKCLAMSLLLHLLLAGYATTVNIVAALPDVEEEPSIRVSIAQGPDEQISRPQQAEVDERPWEQLLHDAVAQPDPVELARAETPDMPKPERAPQTQRPVMPDDFRLEHLPLTEAMRPEPERPSTTDSAYRISGDREAEKIEAPSAQRQEAPEVSVPLQPAPDRRRSADSPRQSLDRASQVGVPSALLSRPVPLPRMRERANTPDAADSLSGLRDLASGTSRGNPADSITRQMQPDAAGSGSTESSGTVAGQSGSERLWQPGLSDLGAAGMRPPGAGAGLTTGTGEEIGPPNVARAGRSGDGRDVPEIYRLRVAPDRSKLAERLGATPETEAAVQAALKWLASNQAADGRWDSRVHGAGQEDFVLGRDRSGAGADADTGVTGLALLAFLAAGHTHQRGDYQNNVSRGLEFLLRSQANDGNLGGDAKVFARMYCHAMATFALSEAFAMSGDTRLQQSIQRAVDFTLDAQDPSGGGWRYKPRDAGDTSQLGWQLLALKSAQLAGIDVPEETRRRAWEFLNSVSSGDHYGLAAYRPSERPSRPMTAEALLCRLFLGLQPDHPLSREAGDFLLGELPGDGPKLNLYYYYYGTLAMYQLQGAHWERWNAAMQRTLLAAQQTEGSLAGSWSPDTVWGGYGGRVYSTALGALCLEVYYRFLPLYAETSTTDDSVQ